MRGAKYIIMAHLTACFVLLCFIFVLFCFVFVFCSFSFLYFLFVFFFFNQCWFHLPLTHYPSHIYPSHINSYCSLIYLLFLSYLTLYVFHLVIIQTLLVIDLSTLVSFHDGWFFSIQFSITTHWSPICIHVTALNNYSSPSSIFFTSGSAHYTFVSISTALNLLAYIIVDLVIHIFFILHPPVWWLWLLNLFNLSPMSRMRYMFDF